MKAIISPTLVSKEYHPDEPFDSVENNGKIIPLGIETAITEADYASLFNSVFTPAHGMPCKYFDIVVTCAKNEQQIKEEEQRKEEVRRSIPDRDVGVSVDEVSVVSDTEMRAVERRLRSAQKAKENLAQTTVPEEKDPMKKRIKKYLET